MGIWLGWGGSQVGRNVGGTNVSFFFFLLCLGEGAATCCQTTSANGDWGQSFDDTLETLMCVSRVLSGTARSVKLSALLHQGWKNPRSMHWSSPPYCKHRPGCFLENLTSTVIQLFLLLTFLCWAGWAGCLLPHVHPGTLTTNHTVISIRGGSVPIHVLHGLATPCDFPGG